MHFLARQGGCMVLAAKGGIKNGAQKGAVPRQRSDTIYLPRARALNPSGRRQPIPDRTLGAQGRKARRRHQPSPAKAGVNLREYWKAPPRSRSRPRRRRLNPQASNLSMQSKKPAHFVSVFLIASLIVLISERKAARWQCRGRSRGGRFPGS